MIPEDQPPIFMSIAAGNLEALRAIVDQEGLDVILDQYSNETAVEYLFQLLQTTDSIKLLANLISIAQHLLDQAIGAGNDELAAALVDRDARCVILDGDTCPAFTGACAEGLTNTCAAILNLHLLTDEMLDHAVHNMIRLNSYRLIGDLFERHPTLHQRDVSYIATSVNLNKPFCLIELLKAGCSPTANITMGFEVHEDDIYRFHIPTHGNLLTEEGHSLNALVEACSKPDGDAQEDLDRTACALILLEKYAGPPSWLHNACDYIIVDTCRAGNFDSIALLTSVGIIPPALFEHYLQEALDPEIDDNTKAILCTGVVSACAGIEKYLDHLLIWNSWQFIAEGCMGLCRTPQPLTLPLDQDNNLIRLLHFITDDLEYFAVEAVEAANSVIQKLITVAERLNEVKSLAKLARDVALTVYPEDQVPNLQNNVADVILIETGDRHQGHSRQHYQLMALQMLKDEFPELLHCYMPDDFDASGKLRHN